ncbi:MAG: hypothetical protein K0S61_4054 [Anaerocolumna sp.]|jgi:hypothetical protein|nr:hypothetical protein [Anaerocolumna sp.]
MNFNITPPRNYSILNMNTQFTNKKEEYYVKQKE